MATTWEKVLDDFNNRFRPFVRDYLDYKIKNTIYGKSYSGLNKIFI